MDKMGADFYFSVGTIRDRLHATPIVMQLPMGAENDFVGNIDLLTMEALTYPAKDDKGNDTLGSIVERGPIPAEYQEKAEEYREALVEAAAEGSDELTEAYLENGELSIEQIKEGIRLLTISSRAFPRLLRYRSAQHGCAARPRRRRGLPALPARHRRRSRLPPRL